MNFLVIILTINLIKRKNLVALDVPSHFIHTLFNFKIKYLFINLRMFFTNDSIEFNPHMILRTFIQNILKGFFHLQKNLHIYQLPTFTILNISK